MIPTVFHTGSGDAKITNIQRKCKSKHGHPNPRVPLSVFLFFSPSVSFGKAAELQFRASSRLRGRTSREMNSWIVVETVG